MTEIDKIQLFRIEMKEKCFELMEEDEKSILFHFGTLAVSYDKEKGTQYTYDTEWTVNLHPPKNDVIHI